MSFQVRFTEEAAVDLQRLFEFLLDRSDGDWRLAERAIVAIRQTLALVETSPFSCRRAASGHPLLRELVIPFGASGYVALFEIDDQSTVTVLAVRHQRERDLY